MLSCGCVHECLPSFDTVPTANEKLPLPIEGRCYDLMNYESTLTDYQFIFCEICTQIARPCGQFGEIGLEPQLEGKRMERLFPVLTSRRHPSAFFAHFPVHKLRRTGPDASDRETIRRSLTQSIERYAENLGQNCSLGKAQNHSSGSHLKIS